LPIGAIVVPFRAIHLPFAPVRSSPFPHYLGRKETAVPIDRIVVIEDDDSMRKAIQRLLVAAGMKSAAFVSAEEMLAADPKENVACVISDMKLPGKSGLELLAELRARGKTSPFILITGHDTPRLREQAHLRGAAYLAKPFLGTELLAAIKAASDPAKP
jgi:two-component system response regulator FixJ